MLYMAKYSTGDSSSTPDDSCQLCGKTDVPLEEIEMAGAKVSVCNDCNPQDNDDDRSDQDTHTGSKLPGKNKNSTDTTEEDSTPGYTISNRSERGNPDWIENADYGNADTPYMQKNYDTKFRHALKENDIELEDLAEDTGIPIEQLKALEQGNALNQEVSKDAIEVIEKALDIEIKEDI